MRRGSLLGFVLIAVLLLGASNTHAAFPGQNGKIAFVRFGSVPVDVYTMNSDGTNRINLTSDAATDDGPAWSPDGTKLAFASDRDGDWDVYAMNPNGTGVTNLTNNNSLTDYGPAWSPDGRKIAFASQRPGRNSDIYVMNTDGSAQTALTSDDPGSRWNLEPAWSPDGSKISFTCCGWYGSGHVWVMNADGSGQIQLTHPPYRDFQSDPTWSPDGMKIAYTFGTDTTGEGDFVHSLHVMNADGSGDTNIHNNDVENPAPGWSPDGKRIVFHDFTGGLATVNPDGSGGAIISECCWDIQPDWQPILHDIPQSADTLHMSLVPMLRQTISSSQCAARGGQTSTHGAPLAFSSCNPPGYLPNTMARLGPSSSSTVEVTGVPGDPVTAADEADLTFNVSANDVRARPGGGDYDPSASPDATLSLILRWSDTYNGPALRAPATGSDLTYSVPVSCVATADPALGSNCSTNTTADALAPGTILEGRRTVITLSRWWLYDSGLNATRGNADDRMFAQSGIYVP